MMKRFLSIAVLCIAACRGSDEPEPLRAPGLRAPTIPGIMITDPLGNSYGAYGSPDKFVPMQGECPDTSQVVYLPEYYDIGPAFPMPSNRSFTLQYKLPCPSNVSIWIVRGNYVGDSKPASFGNATFASPGGLGVKTVMRDEFKAGGIYMIVWDGHSSDDGNEVSAGFYRVYVKANEILMWNDILIFDECEDLPPGMHTWMMDSCY